MAIIREPSAKQRREWCKWVKSRPPAVRAIAERFEPWRLYRLTSSGHRVTIYSINEDGTLTVFVSGEFNAVAFERRVFGINPDDLIECNLPGPDEPLGSMEMDPEAMREYLISFT